MAILGPSTLIAINDILEWTGNERVAALDTGGDSEAGQAERTLARATRRVLMEGYDDTTRYGVSYSPDGSDEVTLASTVLWVRGSGAFSSRRLTTRQDKLYDLDKGASNVFTETAVLLDVIDEIDFEDVTPRLKDLITARAAWDHLLQRNPGDSERFFDIAGKIDDGELSAGKAINRPLPSNMTQRALDRIRASSGRGQQQ